MDKDTAKNLRAYYQRSTNDLWLTRRNHSFDVGSYTQQKVLFSGSHMWRQWVSIRSERHAVTAAVHHALIGKYCKCAMAAQRLSRSSRDCSKCLLKVRRGGKDGLCVLIQATQL